MLRIVMKQPDMEVPLFEKCKPSMAMVAIQFLFTLGTFSVKSLFSNGMSPMVFVYYRQVVATLVMVPITLVVRGPRQMALGVRAFLLVFATTILGLEELKLKSLRTMAKVLGTIISVRGAICMALYRGPNLLGEHMHCHEILRLYMQFCSVRRSFCHSRISWKI